MKLNQITASEYTRDLLARNGYPAITIERITAWKAKDCPPSYDILFRIDGTSFGGQICTVWIQNDKLHGEW